MPTAELVDPGVGAAVVPSSEVNEPASTLAVAPVPPIALATLFNMAVVRAVSVIGVILSSWTVAVTSTVLPVTFFVMSLTKARSFSLGVRLKSPAKDDVIAPGAPAIAFFRF